jgi:hypothetical protein
MRANRRHLLSHYFQRDFAETLAEIDRQPPLTKVGQKVLGPAFDFLAGRNPYGDEAIAGVTQVSAAGVDKHVSVRRGRKSWGSIAEMENTKANEVFEISTGESSCKESSSLMQLLVLCELDPIEWLKNDDHLIR